jgi:dTDP-glucose 4,6-dehydratase
MDWNGKRVLVSGAGGFIGSHLIERLVREGAAVTAVVRYNSRNDYGLIELIPGDINERINVVSCDLRDEDAVEHACQNIDYIFHLGALISIPYSYSHLEEVIDTNVKGTLNILKAGLKNKVERVIHTSTSEVYGTAQYVPMDERHPLVAQSPYAASKIAADKLAESFYHSYELPITIVRPFNTYGPRQSSRAFVPAVITQALSKNEIFLGSLHPRRDMNFVDDVVKGFLKAAQNEEAIGEIINLGSGQDISMAELADKIIAIIGRKVAITFDANRVRPPRSEVNVLIADNSKAKKILKWETRVSIEEGLKKTISWFAERKERYRVGRYNV